MVALAARSSGRSTEISSQTKITTVMLVAAIGAVALGLSGPASSWIEKLPQVLPAVKAKFAALGEPIEYLKRDFGK